MTRVEISIRKFAQILPELKRKTRSKQARPRDNTALTRAFAGRCRALVYGAEVLNGKRLF
jgi:Flp pilus assembly CpaF family ATPase